MEPIRCPGCMRQKTQHPLCEHCGYNETIDNLPHQLPISTMLQGRYEIGKVLGQGGFGITYIGWDHKQQRTVAIKEYYPQRTVTRDTTQSNTVTVISMAAQEVFDRSRARFLKEANILARLNEIPEIVHIFNFFEENNTAYMVMEYLRGANLRQYVRMKGGRISLEKTLTVMRPIMRALQRVHDESLVHRDISPDNIMLLPGGAIKLLDFGAARVVLNADPNRNLSQSTEAILKHGFAPIEQYQSNGTLGPWTDVHALTGTIYYCLTGAIPPEAHKRLLDGAQVQWETVPGLTPGQIAALNKAIAVMPAERTRSVRELEEELYAGIISKKQQEQLDFQVVNGGSGSRKDDRISEVDDWKFTSGGSIANKSGHAGNSGNARPEKKKPAKGGILLGALLAVAVLIGGAAVALMGSGEKLVDPAFEGKADRTIRYEDGSQIEIFLDNKDQETGRLFRDEEEKLLYQFIADYDRNGDVTEQQVYDAKGKLLRTDEYTYDEDGLLVHSESRNASEELLWKGTATFLGDKIQTFREEYADGHAVEWVYDENDNIIQGHFFGKDGNKEKILYFTDFLALSDTEREGKVDYFAASQMAPRGGPAIRPFAIWDDNGGGGGLPVPEKPKAPIAIAITEPEETWPEEPQMIWPEETEETVPEETEDPWADVSLWLNTRRSECDGDGQEVASYATGYSEEGVALDESCTDASGKLLYEAKFRYSGEERIEEIRTASDGTETTIQYVHDICGNLIRVWTQAEGSDAEYKEYDPAEGIVR